MRYASYTNDLNGSLTIISCNFYGSSPAGRLAFIPRIPRIPTDLTIESKRVQFPVRVSSAVTINKSQGQTLTCVGVDLREDCFSHGLPEPYVAHLSRTGNPANQFILLPTADKTKNIVYKEIFNKVNFFFFFLLRILMYTIFLE